MIRVLNPSCVRGAHARKNTFNRVAAAVACALFAPGYGIAAAADAQEHTDEHHAVDEVVVTATPLARTVEQLAQPTAVLSGEELTRRQAASIGELVSEEVGLSSTYFGPVASRPVIRGQFGERVRVLSNGLDSLDASALSEDHQTSLDSILAQRVEIVRGPATLLYGSGAAGGLVNVVDNRIAEQPLDEPVSGSVAMNGNTALGSTAGAARVAFNQGNFNWQVDGFLRDTGNIEIPGFAESAILRALEEEEEEGEEHEEAFGTVENSAGESHGFGAGASWTTDRGFVGLSLTTFDSKYGVPGGHAQHEEEEAEAEEEEAVSIDLEQTRVDLRGELALDGHFEMFKFRGAHNDYTHTEFEGSEVGTLYETRGSDLRFELHHGASDNIHGALGLQLQRIDFDAVGDEAFVPPSVTEQTSLFIFEELRLSDAAVLQMSGRAERQSISTPAAQVDYTGTALGFSLGTVIALSDELDFSANLAVTERHPNSTELYADGAHVAVQRYERGAISRGESALAKEVSTNLDVTLRGGTEAREWALTLFQNDASDYILLQPTGEEIEELPVFDYVQQDVVLYGVEAEARFELADTEFGHLHARLMGDFVHAEVEADGSYLPRIPPLRLGGSLHFTRGALELGVDVTWHDDQRQTAANELMTAGYTLIGAELSYHVEDRDLFFYLRGSNLGDEDARQHSSPLKDSVPLPGRALQAGFRWDF